MILTQRRLQVFMLLTLTAPEVATGLLEPVAFNYLLYVIFSVWVCAHSVYFLKRELGFEKYKTERSQNVRSQ